MGGIRERVLQGLLISLVLINNAIGNRGESSAFANHIFQWNKIWKWAEVGNAFLALLEEQVHKKLPPFHK